MQYNRTQRLIALGALAVLASGALGMAFRGAGGFAIDWYTIDGGGGTSTDGQPDGFEISGTIGQPDAGPSPGGMTGGGFELVGGFWPGATVPVFGDCNGDGNVALFDFACFVDCVTGPGGGPVPPECQTFDYDNDDDVDLLDFAAFQNAFTGL